jgi:hypothetical protein
MLEYIWDRVATILLGIAAPVVWFFFMPDFSPLTTKPLGPLTFDELVKPLVWLVCWLPVGYWTISFLYQGITGRHYYEFWWRMH